MGKKWTDREDAIVREIWDGEKLVKECLHLLPTRTERAILVRAQALDLGRRTGRAAFARSATYKALKALLQSGAVLSSPDVADRYGCSVNHAGYMLKHAHVMKLVHIASWRRAYPGGPYMPEYAWGGAADAEKPGPKSQYEYNRTRYLNKRLKEGKTIGNVFAVAMAQVMGDELPPIRTKKPTQGIYRSRVFVQEAA